MQGVRSNSQLTQWYVAVTSGCSGVIDLAFVLHSAGTVYPERWHYMTQFVINIVKQLDVGPDRTRVAVITWSNTAHVGFRLNQFTSRQDVVQVAILYPLLLFCVFQAAVLSS